VAAEPEQAVKATANKAAAPASKTGNSRTPKNWIANAVLLLATCGILAVLAEGVSRVVVRQRERQMLLTSVHLQWTVCHRYDPDLMWALKPDLRGVTQAYPFRGKMQEWRVSTNAQGLRNPPITPKAGRYRMLLLGDSRTYGMGVSDTETWPVFLQRAMDEVQAGAVDVINAGVCGYTAFQGLQYLRREGPGLEPDMVIAAFGYNEAADIPAPGIGDCDWENPRASGPALVTVLKDAVRAAGLTRAPLYSPRNTRLRAGELLDCLVEMKRWCDLHDATLVLVAWPAFPELMGDVLHQPHFSEISKTAGHVAQTPAVDVSGVLEAHLDTIFLDDIHLNAEGNRLTAEFVAAEIQRLFLEGSLAALPRRPAMAGPPRDPVSDWQADRERYRKWIHVDPACYMPFNRLDDILRKHVSPEERIAEWRGFARAYPDMSRPQFHLGAALEAAGELQQAVEAYRRAAELEPGDAAKHAGLGGALAGLRDWPAAIEAFQKAKSINPANGPVREQLIHALCEMGDFDAARAEVEDCARGGMVLSDAVKERVRRGSDGS
jgi:lysophospholipase L1-like esterase